VNAKKVKGLGKIVNSHHQELGVLKNKLKLSKPSTYLLKNVWSAKVKVMELRKKTRFTITSKAFTRKDLNITIKLKPIST